MSDEATATTDPDDDARRNEHESTTFVILSVPACLAAWRIGFDLGAFETVDYRWFWAVWVLSVVALAASALFPRSDYRLGWGWTAVLAVPSLSVLADYVFDPGRAPLSVLLGLLSVATLPLALNVLAHQLAGDFFRMRRRTQGAMAALVFGVLVVGALVGDAHPRYLFCTDFERIGDYVPENCAPLP